MFDTPYPITDDQRQQYARDGHILLRNVATPEEVAEARRLILQTVQKHNSETRPLEARDTYGKAFLQTMNLWEVEPALHPFVLSRRFGQIAADLMGVESVRLYHDQALFKEPGGGHTPWHQDQFYWPLDTHQTITLWMPLVNLSPEMGTMRFASGSHQRGYLGAIPISDESEDLFRAYVEREGYAVTEPGAMSAGDATFHSGWVLHSAPGNVTDRTREAMTIIYYADGARILEPDYDNRRADLARWFPGQSPGELAASPLNPIAFRR